MKIELRALVLAGMLGALTAVLGSTPLGLVPVPTPAGAATTLHIPAIIAGIVQGPVAGGLVGLVFGFFSFTRATLPFFKDPLIAFLPRILIGVVAAYTFKAMAQRRLRPVVTATTGLLLAHTFYQVRPFTLDRLEQAAAGRAPGWATVLAPVVEPLGLWLFLSILTAGTVAWGLHRLLDLRDAPAAVAAMFGTLTNTVGVLSLIVLRGYFGPAPESVYTALTIGVLHGIPEILVAMFLVVVVHRGLRASRPGTEAAPWKT